MLVLYGKPRCEFRILKPHAQFVIGDFAQDRRGVVVKILPAPRRQFLKNFLRALVPSPPDVSGEAVEVGDDPGQFFGR